MVQQTKESTCTEYGLAHSESGLSNTAKQLSVFVAAKTLELQTSCDKSQMTVSKSVGSPLLTGDSECAGEAVKISGTKRPIPECQPSTPKSTAGNPHIVYVRRKQETDLAKSSIQGDAADCPPSRKSLDRGEATQQLKEMNEPVISTSDAAPLQTASSPSFSSTRRSISPSVGMSGNISSPEKNIKHVHVDCANPSSEDPVVNVTLREQRYYRLQSLLKMLDQSDQCEYVQMLRSLSSVELSRHAVELEKRSLKLSLDEAKEMQRVGFCNVLGNYGRNACPIPSTQQDQLPDKELQK